MNRGIILGLICLFLGILDLLVVRKRLLVELRNYEESPNYKAPEKGQLSLKSILQFVTISGYLLIVLGLYLLYRFQE